MASAADSGRLRGATGKRLLHHAKRSAARPGPSTADSGADRLLACPKCKGKRIEVMELWRDSAIIWDQEEYGLVDTEGELTSMSSEPYKVRARCKTCQHYWTVRGATQIWDIYPKSLGPGAED